MAYGALDRFFATNQFFELGAADGAGVLVDRHSTPIVGHAQAFRAITFSVRPTSSSMLRKVS